MGAVLGAGGSAWAQLRLRRRARRWGPTGLAARARGLGADLSSAAAEGRRAMQDREAELRARFPTGRRR